eukprot:1415565-Amphidinium_carterae.2
MDTAVMLWTLRIQKAIAHGIKPRSDKGGKTTTQHTMVALQATRRARGSFSYTFGGSVRKVLVTLTLFGGILWSDGLGVS